MADNTFFNVEDTIHCYEIKTEYDNFDRLVKQILDYSKVFEYVSVVCTDEKVLRVKEMVPEYCGIISYKKRKNAAFVEIRKAEKSVSLESQSILKCFRNKELKAFFGKTERQSIIADYGTACIEDCLKQCLRNRFAVY